MFDETCCDTSCVHKMKNTEPKSRVSIWHFTSREQNKTKWPHVITFATSQISEDFWELPIKVVTAIAQNINLPNSVFFIQIQSEADDYV